MSGQSNKALLASFQARADASERAMTNLATQFTALTSGRRDFDTENETLLKLREKNEKLKYQLEFLKKRTAEERARGPVSTAQQKNTTTTTAITTASTTAPAPVSSNTTYTNTSSSPAAPAPAPSAAVVVETITSSGNVSRGVGMVARNAPPQEPKKDSEPLKLLGRSEVETLKRLAFVMSDALEASKVAAKGGPFAARPDNFIALRKADHPLIVASKEKNWIIYVDVLRAFEAGVAFYQGEDCYLTRGKGDTHFLPQGCISMTSPSGSAGTPTSSTTTTTAAAAAAAAVAATATSPSSEPAPADGDRPRTASWSKWIGTAAAGTAIAALAWKKFF